MCNFAKSIKKNHNPVIVVHNPKPGDNESVYGTVVVSWNVNG